MFVSHLVQRDHTCSIKFYYTQILVLGMLPNCFKNVRYSLVIVRALNFYPLFDANFLNDKISSLTLENKNVYEYNYIILVTGNLLKRLLYRYYASYKVQTSPVRCRKDCSLRQTMSGKFFQRM